MNLKHRLQSLTSSMSDRSVALEENTAWFREEEEDNDFFTGQLKVKKTVVTFVSRPRSYVLCLFGRV